MTTALKRQLSRRQARQPMPLLAVAVAVVVGGAVGAAGLCLQIRLQRSSGSSCPC